MKKLLRVAATAEGGEASPVEKERLLAGNPMQIVRNAFTNERENFFCGVWSSEAGKWTISYTEDEFCYVISGKAIITDVEGQTETVEQGDAFVIPAGFQGTWETIEEVSKFYAIYED